MKATPVIVIASLMCCGSTTTLRAETWYLPDGSTITTHAGSTPPVSGAQLTPYPNVKQSQSGVGKSRLKVVVPSAPSFGKLKGLLPTGQSQQQPSGSNNAPISTSAYFADAKVGQTGGECAAFAQKARPDLLRYAPYGSANRMPEKAREKGFEVNGTPRVGSVLVTAKPVGSTDGHAAVVTGVQREGERYVLTVMDSNANQDEIISSRTVYYTPSDNGTFGNYGSYQEEFPEKTRLARDLVVMGFIHEKVASASE